MRRQFAWALVASFIAVACATNDASVDPPADPPAPPSVIGAGDASAPGDPDAGAAPEGGPAPSAECGDGHVEAGEECDDGNLDADDGCSPLCAKETAGAGDVCPGATVTLTGTGAATRKATITGTTATDYGQSAGSCGGGTGKDAVYVVKPDVTGLLTATLTSSFDSLLYARRTCDDTKTEAACDDAPGSTGGEQISIAVTKDVPVYLFVDGYSGAHGPFTLDLEVATAFCGNGVAEPPEVCDDGGNLPGDGCAANCTFEAGGVVNDCPGQPFVLAGSGSAPRTATFAGSTVFASTSSTSTPSGCSGSGPNAIYAITPDVDGSLTAKLVADYDNATLHIRTECDQSATQLDCKEATEPLQDLELTVPVKAGLPHYVVVDSASSTYKGEYRLEVTVNPARCGNGIVDGSEECDDANTASGDGCAAGCTLEPPAAGSDTCPGAPLALAPMGDGTYAGVITSATTSFVDDFEPKSYPSGSGCSTYNSGKDAVFAVTSPIDGMLEATVEGNFDTWIYARTACVDDESAYTDLSCSAKQDGNGPETIDVPISAGAPLWIIVDGDLSSSQGTFALNAVVRPAACGNGAIEGGETCDDGNASAGDGCGATCQLEPVTGHDTCADADTIALTPEAGGAYTATVHSGTTNLAHDQTFSGCSSSGADAVFALVAPIDGVLSASVVADGFTASLGVRTSCPPSTSATLPLACAKAPDDVSVSITKGETYYVIVDGTSSTAKGAFTLLVDVSPPGCGDGLISGGESCDDGNATTGDGCSPTCAVEPLAGIDACPGYTLPLAGPAGGPYTAVLTVNTSPLTAGYAGSCGGSSKEGVVVVTPPIDGKLTARLTGLDYQPVLYARKSCNDPLSEGSTLWCDDDSPTPSTASRDLTLSGVVAGTPYYLFVDGYNGSAGVGRLNVTVTP
jgi:cysteine-rich repeat protein